jgi:hypothetical protein
VIASSFHLWWRLPDTEPLIAVRAVCEVVVPPRVDRLYFWALQVGFSDGRRTHGAGHTGLQWHSRATSGRAVNWGGYRDLRDGGDELDGSRPTLPALNPQGNTARYAWRVGQPYRFDVFRSDRGWRATVTDVSSGETTVIRDLFAAGTELVDPVVWSEVFARCDDPSVSIRWTGLEATTASGIRVRPGTARVTYQQVEAGGCTNTTVGTDDLGLVQVTNTGRRVAHGDEVVVPA